jgi:thioredoxin 1
MANLPMTTDETFEKEVTQSKGAVLLDFGAEWCHPCKQLDPIVEEIAQDWKGKVKVLALDIDNNVKTTMQMGVMSVPTLILFLDGEPVERITGYQSKQKILKKLQPYLGL